MSRDGIIMLGIFTLVNVLTFHLTCGVGDYHRVARFLYFSLVLVVLDSQVFILVSFNLLCSIGD